MSLDWKSVMYRFLAALMWALTLRAPSAHAQTIRTDVPGTYSYTVGTRVREIEVTLRGGGGGGGGMDTGVGGTGGRGGAVRARVTLRAGDVYTIVVGGGGAPGGNCALSSPGGAAGTSSFAPGGRGGNAGSVGCSAGGGGGGGASALLLGSTPVMVAGGGGGGAGGSQNSDGGNGTNGDNGGGAPGPAGEAGEDFGAGDGGGGGGGGGGITGGVFGPKHPDNTLSTVGGAGGLSFAAATLSGVTIDASGGAAGASQQAGGPGDVEINITLGCGSHVVEADEGCDDGNFDDGDGCNAECKIETQSSCNQTAPGLLGGASCASGVCNTLTSGLPGLCVQAGICGNSALESGEGCDDANRISGDGCSSTCKVEMGALCNTQAPGLVGDASCAVGLCSAADKRCGALNDEPASNAFQCRSAVRDTDGKCGYSVGAGPCSAEDAAVVCRTAMCGSDNRCTEPSRCVSDADCAAEDRFCFLQTHRCMNKVANGDALVSDASHQNPTLDGTCTPEAAALVCASGVCDGGDNRCGNLNDASCDSAVTCRSAVCDQGQCGVRPPPFLRGGSFQGGGFECATQSPGMGSAAAWGFALMVLGAASRRAALHR